MDSIDESTAAESVAGAGTSIPSSVGRRTRIHPRLNSKDYAPSMGQRFSRLRRQEFAASETLFEGGLLVSVPWRVEKVSSLDELLPPSSPQAPHIHHSSNEDTRENSPMKVEENLSHRELGLSEMATLEVAVRAVLQGKKIPGKDLPSNKGLGVELRRRLYSRLSAALVSGDYRTRTISLRILNRTLRCFSDVRELIRLQLHRPAISALVGQQIAAALAGTTHATTTTTTTTDIERVEALRLLAKALHICVNSSFHLKTLITSGECGGDELGFGGFIAVAMGALRKIAVPMGTDVQDRGGLGKEGPPAARNERLQLAALGTMLEVSTRDPQMAVNAVGTSWLLQAMWQQQYHDFHPHSTVSPLLAANVDEGGRRRVANAILSVLSHWLDCAELMGREEKRKELYGLIGEIAAPLLDLGFFQRPSVRDSKSEALITAMSRSMEQSTHCLLYLMRTWSGMRAIVSERNPTSPLSIFQYLCLDCHNRSLPHSVQSQHPNMDKLIQVTVDSCCEFAARPYTRRMFTSWDEALGFYSQMHLPDQYNSSVRRGFVVAEMEALMESGRLFRERRLDLLLTQRLVATEPALRMGLADALCRIVLAAPDAPISLKATMLLADLLRTASSHRLTASPNAGDEAWRNDSTSLSPPPPIHLPSLTTSGVGEQHHDEAHTGNNALLLLDRLAALDEVEFKRRRRNPLPELDAISTFFLPPPTPPPLEAVATTTTAPSMMNNSSELASYDQLALMEHLFSQIAWGTSTTAATTPSTPAAAFDQVPRAIATRIDYRNEELHPRRSKDSANSLDLLSNLQQQQQSAGVPSPSGNWTTIARLLLVLLQQPQHWDPNSQLTYHNYSAQLLYRGGVALESKCRHFLSQMVAYFSPSSMALARPSSVGGGEKAVDVVAAELRLQVECGRLAFALITRLAGDEPFYEKLLSDWLAEFTENPTSRAQSGCSTPSTTVLTQLSRPWESSGASGSNRRQQPHFDGRSLATTDSAHYFALLRAVGTWGSKGYELMERVGVFQSLLDMVRRVDCEQEGGGYYGRITSSDTSTAELVKAILASLDYSCEGGMPRVILEAALSSKNTKLRKWSSKFLSLIAGLNFAVVSPPTATARQPPTTPSTTTIGNSSQSRGKAAPFLLDDYAAAASKAAGLTTRTIEVPADKSIGGGGPPQPPHPGVELGEYAIQLSIRKLADTSHAVVKSAADVLFTWIHKYPRCYATLHSSLGVLGSGLGSVDEGVFRLLQACCLCDEVLIRENASLAEETLQHWVTSFNAKYVELLEEELDAHALGFKRKRGGGFARSSMEERSIRLGRTVRAPLHLYGALARHQAGRQLLSRNRILQQAIETMAEGCRSCLSSTPHFYHPAKQGQQATQGGGDGNFILSLKAALYGSAQLIANMPSSARAVDRKSADDALRLMGVFASATPQENSIASLWGAAHFAIGMVATSMYSTQRSIPPTLAAASWQRLWLRRLHCVQPKLNGGEGGEREAESEEDSQKKEEDKEKIKAQHRALIKRRISLNVGGDEPIVPPLNFTSFSLGLTY